MSTPEASFATLATLQPLMDKCVHCGFCLSTCPSYLLLGKEMDSPRGRIELMRAGADGRVGMTDTLVGHFDTCLGCMACETACPSGVRYAPLIEETRAAIEHHHGRSLFDSIFRGTLFRLLPFPRRLRVLAAPLALVNWVRRWPRLLAALPLKVRNLIALAPAVTLSAAWRETPARTAAVGATRLRVGLVTGCVQRVFFGDVNAATLRVLTAEGCDVVIPAGQVCCGALMMHAGQDEQARASARQTIDAFHESDVDVIVTNAAGCGSTLKEYGRLLADDPVYAARAAALAARARDISEVLADLEPRAPRAPIRLKVAYHDACHLQHGQGISRQPRQVLGTIPELDVIEIAEGTLCCGSAGIYNLVQPEAAHELGERKARHVLATGASVVASSNPGCLLQIRAELARIDESLPMLHLVELVDASIRGSKPC